MIERRHLMSMLAIVLLSGVISAFAFGHLPDPAPTHWDIHGQADAYGSRWILALGMPGAALGVAILLMVLPRLGPFRSNFGEFRTTYGRICVVVMTALLGIHVVILLKAMGREIAIGSSVSIILGLLFIGLGNWLGKVRRNFYIGIRTPWTLANETVWYRTHRLGGRLMMGLGAVLIPTGFWARDEVCFYVLIGGTLVLTAWAVGYSLYQYRKLGAEDELSSPRES